MGYAKTHFRCAHSSVIDGKLICNMLSDRENTNRERVPHQTTDCKHFCRCDAKERDLKKNQLYPSLKAWDEFQNMRG